MRSGLAAALLLAAFANRASGHRLDEYLQKTLISVEKHRLNAEMTLTPGVAVFPLLIALVDTDADGLVSDAEQRAYGRRVLGELSLTIDGERLSPRIISLRFPSVADMKEGRGEIQLDFEADLPPGGRNRRISLDNRHESRISAYQVNCLVPQDIDIRISGQHRNYTQAHYDLEFEETDAGSTWGRFLWISPIGLLLLVRLARLYRGRATSAYPDAKQSNQRDSSEDPERHARPLH